MTVHTLIAQLEKLSTHDLSLLLYTCNMLWYYIHEFIKNLMIPPNKMTLWKYFYVILTFEGNTGDVVITKRARGDLLEPISRPGWWIHRWVYFAVIPLVTDFVYFYAYFTFKKGKDKKWQSGKGQKTCKPWPLDGNGHRVWSCLSLLTMGNCKV